VVGGIAGLIALMILTAPLVEVDFVRLAQSVPRMLEFLGHMMVMPDWDTCPSWAPRCWRPSR